MKKGKEMAVEKKDEEKNKQEMWMMAERDKKREDNYMK
jgi:hypothetical protein